MTYKSIERMKFYNTPQWFKDNELYDYKIHDIYKYSNERVNIGHESVLSIYTKSSVHANTGMIPNINWSSDDLNNRKELKD
jgi:hypothetical protein